MGSSANQEVRTTSYSTFRDPGNFSSKEAIFTDSGACYGDFHAPWKGSKQEHLVRHKLPVSVLLLAPGWDSFDNLNKLVSDSS